MLKDRINRRGVLLCNMVQFLSENILTFVHAIIDKYNYKTMNVFLFKYGVYKPINAQFKLFPINPTELMHVNICIYPIIIF